MRTYLLLPALLASLCPAQNSPGLKPHANATDYPAHARGKDFTISAALLSAAQVKHQFAADLSRYLVVEVALYPDSRELEISRADFTVRVGDTHSLVRAMAPGAVVAASDRRRRAPAPTPSDTTVYSTAHIGYESGRVQDRATGTTRGGGWYGGVGVGVEQGYPGPGGSAGPYPQPREPDREWMRIELEGQSLPEGRHLHPVAGYLYFPQPTDKRRPVAVELRWEGVEGRILLPLK